MKTSIVKRLISPLVSVCMLLFIAASSLPEPVSVSAAQSEIGEYINKADSWYATSEAISLADEILKYQLSDGGWKKAWNDASVTSGSWAKSTIDNDGTTSEITILAKV